MTFIITPAMLVAFGLSIAGPLILAQIYMHRENAKVLKRMVYILELCPPHKHMNGKIVYVDRKSGTLTYEPFS